MLNLLRCFGCALAEDEIPVVRGSDTSFGQASVLLVLPYGGLQGAKAEGCAFGAGGHDLASELLDHLVVVHLQHLSMVRSPSWTCSSNMLEAAMLIVQPSPSYETSSMCS